VHDTEIKFSEAAMRWRTPSGGRGVLRVLRFEIEDLRDAGGDKVIAVLREAPGIASDLKVDGRSGWVTAFRDAAGFLQFVQHDRHRV
jgi:hypothetical protein